jgi:hypothetical protein
MTGVAGRPGVRGGAATRGFPPGSAQALVALVLGLGLGVTGLRRGEVAPAVVLLVVALLGAVQLARLGLRARASARRGPRR